MQPNVCFVTEIDKDQRLGGAITSDLKTQDCLRRIGHVDMIYLKRQKYRSVWLAFPVFVWQIGQSFSKHYQAYFSRGLFASFTLTLLKPIHRKKVIHNTLSVPFPSIEARYSKRNKLSGFIWFSLMRFLERIVTANVDSIIVADDNYAAELLMNGVQKDKVQTIPFYVENEFFQQPVKSNSKETFRFCYVGGFHPYHILMPVIEALDYLLKNNKDVELLLVGEGPLKPEIESEVMRRELGQKIKFIGKLPHSSIPDFLSKVDSFIAIMHKPGISTSLLEAAAAGKPIITLRRKSDLTLEHYFRHGEEILYVEDTSPYEIAKAMEFVCENPEVRSTLSQGARKVAMKYFSEDVCLNQLNIVMQRIWEHPSQLILFEGQKRNKVII